jgi:predicted outer membrane protein
MSRAGITFVGAIALVAAANVGQADKERCKVKIGDDYHFLDRTYTQGRCEQEAKKYAASRLCDRPDQHFDIRYRFDDVAHEVSGHCRLYMSGSSSSSPSSHDKERCKVKIGDDYHFLDRTYTRGRCEQEAKKYAASRLCDRADQRFDIRYRFDDVPYETTGRCRLYMGVR